MFNAETPWHATDRAKTLLRFVSKILDVKQTWRMWRMFFGLTRGRVPRLGSWRIDSAGCSTPKLMAFVCLPYSSPLFSHGVCFSNEVSASQEPGSGRTGLLRDWGHCATLPGAYHDLPCRAPPRHWDDIKTTKIGTSRWTEVSKDKP